MNLPVVLLLIGVALVAASIAPTLRSRRRGEPAPRRPRPTPTARPSTSRPAPAVPDVPQPAPPAVRAEPAAPPHHAAEDVGALLDSLLGAHHEPATPDEPAPIEDPRRVAEVLRFWLRDR